MKKHFIIGCLAIVFFTACKKELSDNFRLYTNHPLNDTAWVKHVSGGASIDELAHMMFPNLIVDSFDCVKGDTLHYGDSLDVAFSGNSCVTGSPGGSGGGGGIPCTGKVKLEMFRLKTKGDFIKFFKPTTSNGYLLESGGGFFIRLSQNGHEINLATGATVTVRYVDVDSPRTNMQVFYARETIPFLPDGSIDTMHNWLRDLDTSYVGTWQKPNSTNTFILKGYSLKSKNLHWFSAERFTDSTLPKTKITAVLSPNFTNKNTAVFAVFANQKTVVQLNPDYSSRSFAANNIPIGAKITLVSVSRIGTDLYLGVKQVNDVGTVTRYVIEPQVKSLVDILTYLNGR
ncbi:MAG: hypothetical protein NVSMB63_14600 [Sediminibacterium sp.]